MLQVALKQAGVKRPSLYASSGLGYEFKHHDYSCWVGVEDDPKELQFEVLPEDRGQAPDGWHGPYEGWYYTKTPLPLDASFFKESASKQLDQVTVFLSQRLGELGE
jgi:hypothetical protein